MLPDDTKAAANGSARIIDDPRARHFHDPQQRSGVAVAGGLGWEGKVAWDIYLFYQKGRLWTDGPPAPADLMHQLSWEPTHFRTGDDLVRGLRETMGKMLGGRTG